jgi:hypothetical protein
VESLFLHKTTRAGLYLAAVQPLDRGLYDVLEFWVREGGQGGQKVRLALADGSHQLLADQAVAVSMTAGAWSHVKIPLADLGGPAQIGGIAWQDTSGGLSQLSISTAYCSVPVTLFRRLPPCPVRSWLSMPAPIDIPLVTRSMGSTSLMRPSPLPLDSLVRRCGGNATTRYNWKTNMHNVGSDWYFENILDGPPVADGSASDRIVDQDRQTGTKTIMTVPLMGWTPRSNGATTHPYDCAYKVSKCGPQQSTDPWEPDCGNGVRATGARITGNDPADTSIAIGP